MLEAAFMPGWAEWLIIIPMIIIILSASRIPQVGDALVKNNETKEENDSAN